MAARGRSPAASLGFGLLSTAAAGSTLLLLLGFLRHHLLPKILTTQPGLDPIVGAGIAATGALLAAWYLVSATIGTCCSTARLFGSTWRAGERALRHRAAPGMARLLSAGTGAVVAAGIALTPAQATPPPSTQAIAAEDLSWGSEEAPTTSSPQAPPAPETPAPPPQSHTVRPGETLWAIAADHLPKGASSEQIAHFWPRWFETNRQVIGEDPSLILPGMKLQAPAPEDDNQTRPRSKGATR